MCQSLPSFPVIGCCHLLLKEQARYSEPSTPASDNTSSFDMSSPLKPSSLPSVRARTEGYIHKGKRAHREESIKDDNRVSKSFIVSLP